MINNQLKGNCYIISYHPNKFVYASKLEVLSFLKKHMSMAEAQELIALSAIRPVKVHDVTFKKI